MFTVHGLGIKIRKVHNIQDYDFNNKLVQQDKSDERISTKEEGLEIYLSL